MRRCFIYKGSYENYVHESATATARSTVVAISSTVICGTSTVFFCWPDATPLRLFERLETIKEKGDSRPLVLAYGSRGLVALFGQAPVKTARTSSSTLSTTTSLLS